MSYVIDTNIFDRLVKGTINIADLPSDEPFVATHIQIEEINNTKNSEHRARLFLMFAQVRPEIVPTESFVLDVSRLDDGKLSDSTLFKELKEKLDTLNKFKSNNSQDILIAEVAIVHGLTLLTSDQHLSEIVKGHGGKVIHFKMT